MKLLRQYVRDVLRSAKERFGLSWQNLDMRPGDRDEATGHLWKQGRAWLQPWGYDKPGFRLDWNLWSHFNHVDFSLDLDEGEVSGGVALTPIAVWWAVIDVWKHVQRFGPWDEPGGWKSYKKDIKVSFHEGTLFWTFWYDQSHWSNKMPRWRSGSFTPMDRLFGYADHTKETVKGPVDVLIPMPERPYKATVEIRRETWKRPGLPWKTNEVVRAEIDSKGDPIPLPGKGTTSYNCDEDATYGLITPARTVSEAIGETVKSVLRSRERYGGLDWRPEKDHRAVETTVN